jgi:hypothetical protein
VIGVSTVVVLDAVTVSVVVTTPVNVVALTVESVAVGL